MSSGCVKKVLVEKGFGFIRNADGGDDVFFHMTDLRGGLEFDETLTGRRVSFDVQESAKGLKAANVRPVDAPDVSRPNPEEA